MSSFWSPLYVYFFGVFIGAPVFLYVCNFTRFGQSFFDSDKENGLKNESNGKDKETLKEPEVMPKIKTEPSESSDENGKVTSKSKSSISEASEIGRPRNKK